MVGNFVRSPIKMNLFTQKGYKTMMRIVILAVVMLVGGIAFGQGTVIELRPNVRDDDNGKSLGGATIEVYKNGALIASENSSSNGKVPPIELPVCIGCTYTIKIKKAGYVTKTAIMDGHSDYPEEMPPGTVVQKFDVSIFESVEGIDFSFLDREPMVEFAIDSYGIIGFDQQKIKVMQKKIADLRKKMEEKKEQLEKEAREKEKREADFNAYVQAGDAAMKRKEYEKAIGQYELALGIKPDDQPTKDKIQDAKIKLEELRANEQREKDFSEKMGQAKTAYSNNELEKALGLYKEASGIKPEEQLPKDLIAEIEKKIADAKKNEEAFNKLVSEGDAAVGSEDFDQAISKYEQALSLKKDSAVETKLANARKKKAEKENALAEQKALQEKYDQLVAKADGEFDTEKYEEARKNYEEAQKLMPNEAKPKQKIAEIDKILEERAAEQAAAEKLEADYQKFMQEGKEQIGQRKWNDAKSKFEEALKLKPNDSAALDQIDLINKELEKEASEAKLNAEYDAFMKEAEEFFNQKKYAEAKSKYNEASGVKPQEQLPKDKMAEIDRIVADAEKAAELEAQYQGFMKAGDGANDRKAYTEALDNYKKALGVKPGDADAQSKIDAINKIIEEENRLAAEQKQFDDFVSSAQEAFNAKDYDKAKLNYNNALGIKDDADIREKIKEIDRIIAENQSAAETQAKYDAAIAEADALYQTNDYPAALEKYKAALSIKDEDYPKGKISELEEKIAAQVAAEAKEQEFKDLVAEADQAFDAKEYGKALEKYKEAIRVKPDPTITQRIGELDVLIAEQAQNAELRAQYDQKIAEAETAFKDENWNGARGLYEEAGRILPNETYPGEKIAEIERIMADESAAEAERNYQKIIDKADGLMDQDKLDEAKTYYDRAIGIKPSDSYAQEQLDKIAAIKKERADALAEEKRLNEAYDALIKEGEEAANTSNWPLALNKFREALTLKPAESYPQNKIAEIESKLNAEELAKQKEEAYIAQLAKADQLFDTQDYLEAINEYKAALEMKPGEQYPQDKILSAENFLKQESENEIEAAYQKILTTAQKKMDEGDYEKALDLYLRAKNTKPSDPLPQQRIDEINQILQKASENEALEAKYKDFIQEGDYQYEKGEWKQARDAYQAAFDLFNREYPEKRIKECEEAMKAKTNEEENKSYAKIISKADEYFDKQNYTKAKDLYQRAVGIKPGDQYPKDRLLEIEGILNPNAFAKSQPNLTNYGDPNRSVSLLDVENMLADAEEQRKFISSQKAEQQGINASQAEAEKGSDQLDYSHETHNEVEVMEIDIENAWDAANIAREDATLMVNDMQLDLSAEQSDRIKTNENDVQLQNQIVNNINLEIEDLQLDSDLPREEYLADVEEIRTEVSLENRLESNDQENVTYDQKDYVVNLMETRAEADLNMDVARKNTEISVEDYNIRLINENNEDVWNQEDVTMHIKDETEVLRDEQTVEFANNDLARVEAVSQVSNYTVNVNAIDRAHTDHQYDVSIGQKKYTESVLTSIELENLENDIPREQMEVFVENQTVGNNEARSDFESHQTNEIFDTDQIVEELEIAINENKAEDDLKREGYEVTVESIKEGKDDYIAEKSGDNENSSFETVDYINDRSRDRRDEAENADEKADANIDNTADKIDELKEDGEEAEDKNRVDLENAEDYVESLRDINLKEVDEEMKNALGDQFPEGMTEEIYTINDEDGLMVSYVVRRIVVRNGVGNVYERVQTKFGTFSHSCNGSPITEYQWQDETEAADLVRN